MVVFSGRKPERALMPFTKARKSASWISETAPQRSQMVKPIGSPS